MTGAIPALHQYAFMAWYSVKAQGRLYTAMKFMYVTYAVDKASLSETGRKQNIT
jgi:hypothetical protein